MDKQYLTDYLAVAVYHIILETTLNAEMNPLLFLETNNQEAGEEESAVSEASSQGGATSRGGERSRPHTST